MGMSFGRKKKHKKTTRGHVVQQSKSRLRI